MKVDLFDFDLPEDRIATRPVTPRDAARLLYVAETLSDKTVRDLPNLLQPGDVMVFNNTKVIPARLFGRRGEAKVEVTLHKRLDGQTWQAFAKPGKKLRVGDIFTIVDGFEAVVADKLDSGEVVLRFDYDDASFYEKLEQYGEMPLPPYMRRGADEADDERYQTVYAKEAGAVAAPTAGLHFTPELFDALDDGGIKRVETTLHVGAGTFLPVKVKDTQDHVMHAETIIFTAEQADAINAAKVAGGRIVAVGTTAMRVLETAADKEGVLHPFSGETDIFITPGYRFKAVDALLTNFHLPKSTLFMLVSAFSGLETMQAAYAHAIDKEYRFYSYGDACLLERAT